MTDALPYPSAGLFRRLAALVYDSLLLVALSMAYFGLAVLVNVLVQGLPAEGQRVEWGLWRYPVFVGWVITLMGFYGVFWRRFGQTLGMRAWRLKLVNTKGGTPSWGQCWLRCLLACLSLGLFGLGYFWRWLDPQQTTFHDRFSRTRVLLLPKDKN